MANVNLIPEDKGKAPAWSKMTTTSLIVVIIIVAAVLGGMFIWQRVLIVREASLKEEAAKVEAEQEQYAEVAAEAKTLEIQLSSLKQLLDDHVYWSELFWQLEASAFKTNVLEALQATEPGKVEIQGSIPSYNDLAKQIVAYESNSFFKSTKLNNAILTAAADGSTRVSYNMVLWLSDDALTKTDTEVLEDSLRDYKIEQPATEEVTEEEEAAEGTTEEGETETEGESEEASEEAAE